jgi:hypothetical protein
MNLNRDSNFFCRHILIGKVLLDYAGQSSSSPIASRIRSKMEHRHGTILRRPMHGAHQRIWNSSLLYATDFGVYLAGLCLVGDWSCCGPRTWIVVRRLQLYARAACRLSRRYFEAQQLRQLSVSMRSAYGRQTRERVNCVFCVLAAGCSHSLHHTHADNRVDVNPSLTFPASGCLCCRQDRIGRRTRVRVKTASRFCFT